MHLLPEAMKNWQRRCVAHQLMTAVCKRTRDKRNAEPAFASIEDLEAILDDIEDELYPGNKREQPTEDWSAYVPLWARHITPQRPRKLQELEAILYKGNLDRDGELPPLAAILRKRGIDLRTSFGMQPDTFRVHGERVVYYPIELDADVREQQWMPKAEPYTHGGWRDVGVTSHMLLALARRLERPVHVIHNDRKVFSFGEESQSAIVYNVWGDHAFFYRPRMSMPASKLVVKPLVEVPDRCLAIRGEDVPSRKIFEKQRYFDIEEVEHYYHQAGALFTLDQMADWGTWWTYDLKTAARLVGERLISYRPRYVSAHKFSSFTMRNPSSRKKITVYEIPEHHHNALCREFSELTGLELEYHDESIAR